MDCRVVMQARNERTELGALASVDGESDAEAFGLWPLAIGLISRHTSIRVVNSVS